MRQYCLLCTRIFDQPKAGYLQLPMAVTPDAKRFSLASKHQFPSFSANFHPSMQNWSTLQLIYQVRRKSLLVLNSVYDGMALCTLATLQQYQLWHLSYCIYIYRPLPNEELIPRTSV